MKPSPALWARLSFTTKEVGRGFYRGTRTGSMGAHTEWGGYLIDWRKVRNFNAPDLTDFKLTPFVTREMEPTTREVTDEEGNKHTPEVIDHWAYLFAWRDQNPQEYERLLEYQREQAQEREVQRQEQEVQRRKGKTEKIADAYEQTTGERRQQQEYIKPQQKAQQKTQRLPQRIQPQKQQKKRQTEHIAADGSAPQPHETTSQQARPRTSDDEIVRRVRSRPAGIIRI